jgi:hypothetical protein
VPASERLFWRGGHCSVYVTYTDTGSLSFSGHDLAAFGTPGYEYEYDIIVDPDQFEALRRALGAGPGADVLDAACGHVAEIMPAGEHSWLEDHGVEHTMSTRHCPPD